MPGALGGGDRKASGCSAPSLRMTCSAPQAARTAGDSSWHGYFTRRHLRHPQPFWRLTKITDRRRGFSQCGRGHSASVRGATPDVSMATSSVSACTSSPKAMCTSIAARAGGTIQVAHTRIAPKRISSAPVAYPSDVITRARASCSGKRWIWSPATVDHFTAIASV